MSRDWRALLHGWPYPAVVVDQESVVMERNTAADRLVGSSLVIGSPLREAVHYVEAGQPGVADVVEVHANGVAVRIEMTIAAFGPGGIVEFRPFARTFVLDHRTGALVEAGLALARERHLDGLLQRLVAVARTLTHAQYAALGVLDSSGTRLGKFLTSGMSAEEFARMGPPPSGKGVLGHLIRHPEPIRLADLRNHPASAGSRRIIPS